MSANVMPDQALRQPIVAIAVLSLDLAACVGGAPRLSADQQAKVATMAVYRPGANPPGEYRALESISAADCSGAPAGGRVWGNAGRAIETLKKKAAALGADAVFNVSCGAVPLLNNCWAAQKCSGDAVMLASPDTTMRSAGPGSSRLVSVTPRQLFADDYVNITAPSSAGWQLLPSSGSGMAFAKGGEGPRESFGAQVLMFNLPPTTTPDEFEALIRTSHEKDTDTSRFNVQQASYQYSNERSYPCVRYHSVVQDKTLQASKGPLLLEADALYCRHPARQETGFAAIYSHRGEDLYPSLRSEAESFIQGVQVPDK
jgi:hypothetical protein